MFEHCGRRTDGRRTTDHGYTISSPCEPNGSGELKTEIKASTGAVTGVSYVHKGKQLKNDIKTKIPLREDICS